jgi:hypothetical protein
MTLENTLLQSLAKWRFPSGDRRTLTAEDSGWVVAVHADSADTVGCHVWEVALSRPNGPAGAVDLKARAARIAGSVTGLLEPLKLLEADEAHGTALLRSESPRQTADSLFYYEVLLGADGAASARRYEAERTGAKRKQIAFTLTHEALAQLADDLAV